MNEMLGVNYSGVSAIWNGKNVQRKVLNSLGGDTISFETERVVKSLRKTKPFIEPLVTTALLLSGSEALRAEQPENSSNATIQGRQRAYVYSYVPSDAANKIDKALEEGNLYIDDTKFLRKGLDEYCRWCKKASEANSESRWANVPLFSFFFEKPKNPDYDKKRIECAVRIASEIVDIRYPEKSKNLHHAFAVARTFDVNVWLPPDQIRKLRGENDIRVQKQMFVDMLLENNGIKKNVEEKVPENVEENTPTSPDKDEIIDGQNMEEVTLDLIKGYDEMIPEFGDPVSTKTGVWFVIGYGTAFSLEEIGQKNKDGNFLKDDNGKYILKDVVSKEYNINGETHTIKFKTYEPLPQSVADELALYHFLESEQYVKDKLGIPVKNRNYLILPAEIAYLGGKGLIDEAPNMMQALRDLNTFEPGTEKYNDALIRFIKESSDIGLSDTINGNGADIGHFQRHISFANLMLKRLGYDENKMRNNEEVATDYAAARDSLNAIISNYENNRKEAAHKTADEYVRSVII